MMEMLHDPTLTCRICLLRKTEMVPIFEHTNAVKIDDQISYCSNIVLENHDNMPSSICSECLKELDTSVKFKRKCERSDKTLKQYIKTERDDIDVKEENTVPQFCSGPLYDVDCDVKSKRVHKFRQVKKIKGNESFQRVMENDNCLIDDDKLNTVNVKTKNEVPDSKTINEPLDDSQNRSKSNVKFTNKKSHKTDALYDNLMCDTCNLQCQNKWVLKVHMRTHSGERPYQCDLCKKRFVSNSNMRMHKRLTHNEDKQVCSECGKSFSCLTYLKRHLIIHYKVKPYGCTICQKRFTTKSYLKEHIARHKGDKRFFCEICASKFISDVNLKQHMLVHGIQNRNFKRHQCTFCDYKTMGRVDLARHIRKHTGEKPFRCPEDGCQSAFAGKASLKLHIRIHTGEKPYSCSECPAKFSRGDKHKNHMLKKHNITNVNSNKRSKLVVKELAEAVENGHTTPIPIDILNTNY